MAEATTETPTFDRAADTANLKSVGKLHFVMGMGALTLWGAADAWAVQTDWGLAWAAAMANAVIATYVLTGILHEWGHYAGARLSGSLAPARPEPVNYFFMFDFSFKENDTRQFVWMSLGGILVPWLMVLGTLWAIPIDNPSRALLLAGLVTRAVQVSLFEVPVTMRASQGGDPRKELGAQLKAGFTTSRNISLAVGALVWLAA